MTIRKGFLDDGYTKINNKIAQDTSISLEARGVWIDLATRPADWTILPKYMAKQCGIGRDKMYRLLNELIEAGVCQREQARQRTKDGREVIGKMEYVVYNDYVNPSKKSSVRPGFQDTESQCPESQYTDEPYTTNKRVKETKEKKKKPLQSPLKKDLVPPKPVVVFPSLCQELGATADDMRRLLKLFNEEEIVRACEVAKSQGSIPDIFFAWVRDCIEQGWEAPSKKPEEIEANKRVIRDCFTQMDGRKIGPFAVCVGVTYVEFNAGGNTKAHRFDVDQKGFEILVRAFIEKARESS